MINSNKTVDSWLVLASQTGSEKAVALLVKRWHLKLCRHAYWYTKDRDTAKDIAQDSWGIILKKLHQLEDPNSFGSWAMTIVTRTAINWLRKHKKEITNLKSYYDDTSCIVNDDCNFSNEDALVLLRNAINILPNLQQVVLHLFYLEEYSIKQISSILNISTGTVKSRLFTAREKLKIILKNRNDEK